MIKLCKYIYKDLNSNLKRLGKYLENENISKVVVMGHSLLGVDEFYYQKFF